MAPRVESASKESLPNVWAPVLEQGLFTPKKMRVITAGAGHAGLMVAYKMRHEIKCEGFVEHVIYEKNVRDSTDRSYNNQRLINSLARCWWNLARESLPWCRL